MKPSEKPVKTSGKEIEILESVHQAEAPVRQRDLAEIAGLSLGMTNAILKRLAQKGLITIRKVNNRNIRYAVSPAGMEVIMRRSYGYFRRTIKYVVQYRETLEEFARNVRRDGYDGLYLAGKSDIDFIVEHACRRSGLAFLKTGADTAHDSGLPGKKRSGKIFTLYSEDFEAAGRETGNQGRAYLRDMVVERKGR